MTRMKLTLGMAMGLSVGLTGCFGPGDPVELPKAAAAAAETCFAAQSLVWRADHGEGETPSYSEFSKIIHYPMVAAAQTDPFTVETISSIISGAGKASDDIRSKDYKGAIATCEKRFGVDKAGPNLPEDDNDAFLSCLSMGAFMAGVVEEGGVSKGEEVGSVTDLVARLQKRLETNPDLLVKMIQNDSGDVMEAALKVAFAEGEPAAYLKKCEARFPA